MSPSFSVMKALKNIMFFSINSTSSFAYSRSRERERMRSEDHYSVVIQWRSSEDFFSKQNPQKSPASFTGGTF